MRIIVLFSFLLGVSLSAWADAPAVPGGLDSGAATAPAVPGEGGAPVGAQPKPPGIGSMLLPLGVMFLLMWFLMIRPQQKKMKQHQELLKNLTDGDEVLTSSGMLGRIVSIADNIVTVEIARNVKVKMLKQQVQQVVKGDVKDLSPAP